MSFATFPIFYFSVEFFKNAITIMAAKKSKSIEEKLPGIEEKHLKRQDGTNAILIKYVVVLSPDESKRIKYVLCK